MTSVSRLIGAKTFQDLLEKSLESRLAGGYDVDLLATRKSTEDAKSIQNWAREVSEACRKDLLNSSNGLFRRTGLVIVSNACVGMRDKFGEQELMSFFEICYEYLDDEDAKVRYGACEGIYNIVRANSNRVVILLSRLLQAVSKVAGDVDTENRQTALVLDRLIRESVLVHLKSDLGEESLRSVWSCVESSMLLPSATIKQLSLDWMVFLRDEFSPQVYHERVAHFFPPLLSLVSAMEGSSGARKDLAFQAEHYLRINIKSEALVTGDTRNRLLGVLIKYGKFQSTLNEKAKTLLFEYFQTFGENPVSSRQACDLVLVSLDSFLQAGVTQVIKESILEAHNRYRECPRFIQLIIQESAYFIGAMEKLLQKGLIIADRNNRDLVCEFAVNWMHVLTPRLSFDGKLLIPSVSLIVHQQPSNTQLICKSLGLLGRWCALEDIVDSFVDILASLPVIETDGAIRATLASLEVDNRVAFIKAVANAINLRNSDVMNPLFTFIRGATTSQDVVLRDALYKSGDVFHDVCSDWKGICPVGFILLAIYVGRLEDARVAMSALGAAQPVEQLEAVVDLVESDVMIAQRIALVSGEGNNALVRILRDVGMRLGESSTRYSTLIKRIQLAS